MNAAEKADDRRWPIPAQRRRIVRKEQHMLALVDKIRTFDVSEEVQDQMIAAIDALYVIK